MNFLGMGGKSRKMAGAPYNPDFGVDNLMPHLLCLHEYGLLAISCQENKEPGSPENLGWEIWEQRKQAQYLEFFIPIH